jgi:hypothetical protein
VRQALLQNLRVTPQALSQRVQKIKKQHPMTTTDATYVIAHKSGVMLDRYLAPDEVDRVRQLIAAVSRNGSEPRPWSARRHAHRDAEARRTIIIGREFKGNDPMLSNTALNEAKQMAAVYPLLYVLENSMREAIDRLMSRRHGPNWWDAHTPQGLRDQVESRKREDKANMWHQRRGAKNICYLDLDQLKALVRNNRNDFEPAIVPSIEWFSQFVDELYRSRCVLAHMNPLTQDNIQAVKLSFKRWQKQIKTQTELL